jgi:hypothetical protein
MTALAGITDELRTPDGWFALGATIYTEVVSILTRVDVSVDPALRFERSDAPSPSYHPSTRTIQFGIPDPATPKGRLYWYFVQHLVGAPDLEAVQRAIELPLPWVIGHEVAHHLRHYHETATDNHFVEEHAANHLAVALMEEHPIYRQHLPDLQRWAVDIVARTRSLSPETGAYLAGDRLDVGEVLVAQGVLDRATWDEAARLAVATGAVPEVLLTRRTTVTPDQIARARAARAETEAYFNRRYMTSLVEYWLFGAAWLATYLVRPTRPPLKEALARFLPTVAGKASKP